MRPISLSLICDFAEEGWPSMDLVADMLFDQLHANHSVEFHTKLLRPEMRLRFSRLPAVRSAKLFWNADRLINRHVDYPRWLRGAAAGCDLFHIVDHSYAQLTRHLPARRTVVTCHDLDAFRCLLDPDKEPRPAWFRSMTQRTLDGLCGAAEVICVSEAVRSELLQYRLLLPERINVIHNGIHPSCSPVLDTRAEALADALLEPNAEYLLHVGSTIARKRIDILLDVYAAVRKQRPGVKLLRVGGPFTKEQARQAESLGVAGEIRILPFLDRDVLAAVYRRAALLLLPSDAEGFGLPVLEALACGCPVLASDLPVLTEIAGSAVTYSRVADVTAWVTAVLDLLEEKQTQPDRWDRRKAAGLRHANGFTWAESVRRTIEVYRRIINN
jgi:glycosyltransferase involved in cell wall biosynthesis